MAAGARKAACSCARDHCSSDGNQGRDSATSKGERGTVRPAHGAVCRSLFLRLIRVDRLSIPGSLLNSNRKTN